MNRKCLAEYEAGKAGPGGVDGHVTVLAGDIVETRKASKVSPCDEWMFPVLRVPEPDGRNPGIRLFAMSVFCRRRFGLTR